MQLTQHAARQDILQLSHMESGWALVECVRCVDLFANGRDRADRVHVPTNWQATASQVPYVVGQGQVRRHTEVEGRHGCSARARHGDSRGAG